MANKQKIHYGKICQNYIYGMAKYTKINVMEKIDKKICYHTIRQKYMEWQIMQQNIKKMLRQTVPRKWFGLW
jgi:hypothetical protein